MDIKGREKEGLRPVKIYRNYLKDPEGSALIEIGNTKVLCAATVTDKVPSFLKGTGEGWVTAEYALLPRSTPERNIRESRTGRPDSRSLEISRMIGRALRGAIDLTTLGEHSIIIDCDVIQADGGTRTAAITGGFCALYDATRFMLERGLIKNDPIREFVAAVSVGIVDGEILLDLSYDEDVRAEVDLNVAMTESGKIIEIQGTGEKRSFSTDELNIMINLAWKGISQLIKIQKEVLLRE
jgi:ribonuclease PH